MKAVQRKKPIQIAVVLSRDIAKEAVPALKFLLLQLTLYKVHSNMSSYRIPTMTYSFVCQAGKNLKERKSTKIWIDFHRHIPIFCTAKPKIMSCRLSFPVRF